METIRDEKRPFGDRPLIERALIVGESIVTALFIQDKMNHEPRRSDRYHIMYQAVSDIWKAIEKEQSSLTINGKGEVSVTAWLRSTNGPDFHTRVVTALSYARKDLTVRELKEVILPKEFGR